MRQAAKIDENQPDIVDALRRVGCEVQTLADAGKGIPDLLVYSPFLQRNLLLEVKDGNKPPSKRRLTPKQRLFHRRWPRDIFVVKSVEEALNVVGAL